MISTAHFNPREFISIQASQQHRLTWVLQVVGTVAFGVDFSALEDEAPSSSSPSSTSSPSFPSSPGGSTGTPGSPSSPVSRCDRKTVATPADQLQQALRSAFQDFGSASPWQASLQDWGLLAVPHTWAPHT